MSPNAFYYALNLSKFQVTHAEAEPDKIRYVCMDMSNAYHTCIKSLFPNAGIVFDKFHIII